jgi:alpha-amylase
MNWDDNTHQNLLLHWQKLGQFRHRHPAIGAGVHQKISDNPYFFTRSYNKNGVTDNVMIGLDLPFDPVNVDVSSCFPEARKLHDAYSGKTYKIKNGVVEVVADNGVVLLEAIP